MKQARKMMALWCQRKRYTGGVLQIQHHFANTGIKSGIQKTKTTPFPEHTSEQFAPLDLCQQAPPEDIHSQNPHAYAKQQPGHGGCTTKESGRRGTEGRCPPAKEGVDGVKGHPGRGRRSRVRSLTPAWCSSQLLETSTRAPLTNVSGLTSKSMKKPLSPCCKTLNGPS